LTATQVFEPSSAFIGFHSCGFECSGLIKQFLTLRKSLLFVPELIDPSIKHLYYE
jgi:hypothetical protein